MKSLIFKAHQFPNNFIKMNVLPISLNCSNHGNFQLNMGITKPCIHVNPAPSSSIQLHPAPSTSTRLISTFTQLHLPTPSSFQPPPSSLQHPGQYFNQNIVRNWAISPNLCRKIKCFPFWLKIGTHDILQVLIPNPDLYFWNSDAKIQIWAQKVKVVRFVWKLVHMASQGCWFLLQHWFSEFQILISFLSKFVCELYANISSMNFQL